MGSPAVAIEEFIDAFARSPLARWRGLEPWQITTQSALIVQTLLAELPRDDYRITDDIAVHRSATVEPGAVLKGPLIIGPQGFVATGAYLRGGNWLAERCTIGPGAELKSSMVFAGTKLAHFNFVGDAILGEDVNLEAGSIVCNYRNERDDQEIQVRIAAGLHRTGCTKFGALIGSHARIGANAVLAPGAMLVPGSIVRRGTVRDDEVETN